MPTLDGVKYACEPCMRGHRSSRCTHTDRILVQVRKPGRPLSSCPHASGQCSCNGLRMAIPKTTSCACGTSSVEDSVQQAAPLTSQPQAALTDQSPLRGSNGSASSHRVEKPGRRRSSVAAASLIRAVSVEESKGTDLLGAPGTFTSTSSGSSQLPWNNGNKPPVMQFGPRISNGMDVSDHDAHNVSLTSPPASETFSLGQPKQGRPASAGPAGHTSRISNGLQPSPMTSFPHVGNEHNWQTPWLERKTELPHNHEQVNGIVGSASGNCCGPKIAPQVPVAAPVVAASCCSSISNGAPRVQETPRPFPTNGAQEEEKLPVSRAADDLSLNGKLENQHASASVPAETTFYFPPEYSSFLHPLTPDELAFLQKNKHLFSPVAPPQALQSLPGDLSSTDPTASQTVPHNCNCGDTCNCLGCAAHPYNARTLSFVQSLTQIMEEDVSRPEIAFSPQQPKANGGYNSTYPSHMIAQQDVSRHPASWQSQPPNGATSNGVNYAIAPTEKGEVSLRGAEVDHISSPTKNGSLSPTGSEQMMSYSGISGPDHSISPSAYFHVDYPTGDCAKESNVCFCGDGCTCVGCMVHNRRGDQDSGREMDQLFNVDQGAAGQYDAAHGNAALRSPSDYLGP